MKFLILAFIVICLIAGGIDSMFNHKDLNTRTCEGAGGHVILVGHAFDGKRLHQCVGSNINDGSWWAK